MANRVDGVVSPSPVPNYDASEEKYQKELKELEPFNALGVMNEGFSVLPDDGNRKLKAVMEKVAPIIAKEEIWTDEEVREVKMAYIKIYSLEAMRRLVLWSDEKKIYKERPLTMEAEEVAAALVEVKAGIPTTSDWMRCYKETEAKMFEDAGHRRRDDDLSKAERHDQLNRRHRGNSPGRRRSRSRSRSRSRGRDGRNERPRSPRRDSRGQRLDRDGYRRPRSRSPRDRNQSRSLSRYPRNGGRRDGGGNRPSLNRQNRSGGPGVMLEPKHVHDQPMAIEKAFEEKLAAMEKKMELKFKADCEAAVVKAYQDGRKQAEEALTSYKLPFPPNMIQCFKELKYVPIKQILAVMSRVGQVTKPREFAISAEMKVVVPEIEGGSNEGGKITPLKFYSALMEGIYAYFFLGGHKSLTLLKKMMDYWRLLHALYEHFTFESIMQADEYVRSREEAQGNPKTLTWAIDQTTRYRLLREYQPGSVLQLGGPRTKKKPFKVNQPNVLLPCDAYIKGLECKRPQCIYYHGCKPCKIAYPSVHPLATCVSLDPRTIKLKNQKVKKTIGRPGQALA